MKFKTYTLKHLLPLPLDTITTVIYSYRLIHIKYTRIDAIVTWVVGPF